MSGGSEGLFGPWRSRVAYWRTLDARTLLKRGFAKMMRTVSYRINLRKLAYGLDKYSVSRFPDHYFERPESGAVNLDVKLQRVASGGPFEPVDVSMINSAAVSLLHGERRILEVGSGTGMFAHRAGSAYPQSSITASEFDSQAVAWARAHRGLPNVTFCSLPLESIEERSFDVVVALEVVEHIADYGSFLGQLSRVALRALISTPNKNRSALDSVAATPEYDQHVREWTAGEFYWVLRIFYDSVELYTVADFAVGLRMHRQDEHSTPALKQCSVLTREPVLIADCSLPRVLAHPGAITIRGFEGT